MRIMINIILETLMLIYEDQLNILDKKLNNYLSKIFLQL